MQALLNEIRRTGLEVTVWTARAAHFRQMAEGLRCPMAAPERVKSSGGRSAMEDCTLAAVEAQERADMAAKRHMELVARADGLIAQIPRREWQDVLSLRYIAGMSADGIAERLHISKRTYYRMHRSAMEAAGAIRDE